MMDFEIVKSLRHGLQGSGQIFERTNVLPVRPVSTEPFKSVTGLQHCLHTPSDQVKNSHGSAGPVQTRRGFVQVFVRSKLILPDPCKPGLRSLILCLNGRNIGEKL